MHEQDGLLEDMQFDAELEGFLSGTQPSAGMVNLAPLPTAFGGHSMEHPPVGDMETGNAKASGDAAGAVGGAAGAAAAAAAAAGAAAIGSALISGKFGDASQAAGGVLAAVGTAAVPTSLQPVKETTARFLQKAQPWREFLLPLAAPNSADGCSRLTSNVYNYQTNYAILFVIYLVVSIMLQPSALMSLVITTLVWIVFLKKNDDPEWQPKLGGVALGPMQRWLLLAAATAIILLVVAGSTIFNSALFFLMLVFVHGLVHDTSAVKSQAAGDIPL